jgi:3-dehydroquinate synthase
MRIGVGGYEVIVGRGTLADLPVVLRDVCPAHLYAVIADHHVAELHGATVRRILDEAGLPVRLVTFPPGEWNKTREQWAELTDRLLAAHIGRDGAVITFGGGVATDLGGFVASTYLRGIPVVHVPTSLLAMVDAAIGGKTGVDVPAGKNLVGTFHPPRAVVADVDLLVTLPRPHVASGLAEVIKHGLIADAAHFAALGDPRPLLARDPDALEPLVRRSMAIKAAVVAEDEREQDRRAILNCGHTVGHAVEALSGFGLLHGEAVAIGMHVESWIAESLGVAEPGTRQAVAAQLERCGLPLSIPPEHATDALLEVMRADKKVRTGVVRMALPRRIGEAARDATGAWTIEVPEELLRQALDTNR